MTVKNLTLLFVLYGGPGIAALLFLLLGFLMARTRLEVWSAASSYWSWCARRSCISCSDCAAFGSGATTRWCWWAR